LNIDRIWECGYRGFQTKQSLDEDGLYSIPDKAGVYMSLWVESKKPCFIEHGTGGYFKGKDPNVSIATLEGAWVNDTVVIYIGKAGKTGGKATLKSRIKKYLQFANGRPVGHFGGRYLWQIENSAKIIFCWKVISNREPRREESELLSKFFSRYQLLPFANLKF